MRERVRTHLSAPGAEGGTMRGTGTAPEEEHMPDPGTQRNRLEEAARRYDTDAEFRRTVDGDGARDLEDADIDFDSLPSLAGD